MRNKISFTYIYILVLHIYAFLNYRLDLDFNFPILISINLGIIWFIYLGFSGFEESKNKIYSVLLGFTLASYLSIFLVMHILPQVRGEYIIAAFTFLLLGIILTKMYKGSTKLHLLNVLVYLASSSYYFIKF